ncbi:MAG: hypothetical protein PHN45_09260 [Methylococcales bacterium]|nr:hypothetical protein [Methylococcales bacterium]MDD5754927.1 hypothetical protein [Methylococcales bacterium]
MKHDSEMTWIDNYYESLEFFYWEPQHLGKKKSPDSKIDTLKKAQNRLRNMEVTLNQNLHQFFLLAPNLLRNELFSQLFRKNFQGDFFLEGRNVDEKFKLNNCVQPDILFNSETQTVAVEMKIGAKSSLNQVLKYALLGLAVELQQKCEKEHFLVFLGKGNFADQWDEKFESIGSLRDALMKENFEIFFANKPFYIEHLSRFEQILRNLSIHFLNYEEFSSCLLRELPLTSDLSSGAQVYRKLIGGVIEEFKGRGLIS